MEKWYGQLKMIMDEEQVIIYLMLEDSVNAEAGMTTLLERCPDDYSLRVKNVYDLLNGVPLANIGGDKEDTFALICQAVQHPCPTIFLQLEAIDLKEYERVLVDLVKSGDNKQGIMSNKYFLGLFY